MSETPGTRDVTSAAPEPAQVAEYQPPAIAWEEPLEAIAASSCVLISIDSDCQGGAAFG